jgi:hypothetical protein
MSASPTGSNNAELPGAALLAAALDGEAWLRDRLAAAGGDLSRPRDFAIDDAVRARSSLVIEAVLGAIEAALRAAEPWLDAAPAQDLAARFIRAGLLAQSGLVAIALMRVEEHRLSAALVRSAEHEAEGPGIRRLDPIGGDFAAESFAVRAAEAARLDRTGEPLLPLHDIPAEVRHALFWQVAACLADSALALQGEARAGNEDASHRAAAAAVGRALAGIDDGDGIAPAVMRFAESLSGVGQLDDSLLAGTLAAGRIASLAAMLAVRIGVPFEDARAALTDPARCALLLRACDVAAETAKAMIVTLAFVLDRGLGEEPGARAAAIVADYDLLAVERARVEVRRARLEPAYRDALGRLSGPAR